MIVSEWGSSLIEFFDVASEIPKGVERKIEPGTKFETVHELEVNQPMSAHDWSIVVGKIVDNWEDEAPAGAEAEYVAVETGSPTKVKVQFRVPSRAALGPEVEELSIIGWGVWELVFAVIIPIIIGGAIAYYAIDVLNTTANEIKSLFEDPTANIGKTVVIMGGGLAALMIVTRD